jgi:hypothetical protein
MYLDKRLTNTPVVARLQEPNYKIICFTKRTQKQRATTNKLEANNWAVHNLVDSLTISTISSPSPCLPLAVTSPPTDRKCAVLWFNHRNLDWQFQLRGHSFPNQLPFKSCRARAAARPHNLPHGHHRLYTLYRRSIHWSDRMCTWKMLLLIKWLVALRIVSEWSLLLFSTKM